MILLLNDIGVLKVSLQLFSSLNSGIANFTNFIGVEQLPFVIMKLMIELNNKFSMNEIQEGISNITVILNV
jgi:hypothetical protein